MGGRSSKENSKKQDADDSGSSKSSEKRDSINVIIGNTESIKSNVRKNSKKHNKIQTDTLHSDESKILKTIKKNNKQFEDAKLIDNCLTKHFFMRALDRLSRAEIIKEMTLCSVSGGDILFSQGSVGAFFYIIKQGQVELSINDAPVKSLKDGESFGELALLHGGPRSGTIKAVSDCLLWVLERKNFKKIVDHINHMNFEENKKFILSVPMLANIENDQKSILCSNLIKASYEPGQQIVKEGEVATCLYIVKEGEVNCVSKGTVVRTLQRGEHFGEKAILLDSNRTMDIFAKTKCVCYSISVETLKAMVGEKYRDILYINFLKSAFTSSQYINKINMRLVEESYDCFQVLSYQQGAVVVNRGYVPCSKFILLVEGSLVNAKTKEVVASRGNILFERELYEDREEKTEYDLIADPDCLILQAKMKDFTKILGGSFIHLIHKSSLLESIMKVHLFKNFPKKKLNILCETIQLEMFEDKAKIISQGEDGSKFYLVKSGKVDIYINDNYIRSLNENEYFGERALFFREPRSATAIANGPVELLFLEKEDFMNIIESNMKEFLLKRLYLRDESLELKDFDFVCQLGAGNYGLVNLVQSRKNKFLYAIKGIAKRQIDSDQLHKNLELERAILLQVDHPFIVKLVKTLKDSKYIYFLMEYVKGKELFNVIREIGLLNKYQTQFYGASMMVAVEYLHKRKFIYRDIKPENIMVIKNGYIKLIDFGTAKQITDRTSTIIGTPHYMAPEVVMGEGYSFAVDYWSIAVCLFEFICGSVPFGENADDPMDVYLTIINDQLFFPPFCADKQFKHLISSMLSKNPLSRLFQFAQIKNHVWFNDFNWDDLISMNLTPAFISSIPEDDIKSDNIPFETYVKKEGDNAKSGSIDPKLQVEYDKWFKEF